MRILQICPYDIDRPGGVQRHILDLSRALRKLGHEVEIVAPRMASSEDAAAHITRVGEARLVALNKTAFEFSIAKGAQLRSVDALLAAADIVHFHTMMTPFLSWQLFARSRGVNVATFHDFPPATAFGDVQKRVYRHISAWLAKRLDGIVTTTAAMAGHIAVEKARVARVLPPCTALSRFGPHVAPAVTFPDARVNILFLGRFEPRKGGIVLLEAHARLEREGLPVRLLMVGDGPERAKFERFIGENKLAHVVFPGAVARDAAPEYYAACDIFCAPSLYGEGFGIVLAEALASRKAIVAAQNAGYKMVLGGNAGQELVASGDVDALHARLRDLVTDAALREDLAARGPELALKYDADVLAPDFLAFYEQAMASRAISRD